MKTKMIMLCFVLIVLLSVAGGVFAKAADIPSRLNADIAVTGAMPFDVSNKIVYSDHGNKRLHDQSNEAAAASNVDLWITDEDGVRMVWARETNFGDLCADAFRAAGDADIALVNGGCIRENLKAGDLTADDIKAVFPFENQLYVVRATGKQILDALEWSSRKVQAEYKNAEGEAVGENGGFFQVSGLCYTVDTSIESPALADENNVFLRMIEDAPHRVSDVEVMKYGEWVPLDPNAWYSVASTDFILKYSGDGVSMFLDDEVMLDNGIHYGEVVVDYISFLHGELSAYQEAQGRITIK